MRFDDLPLASTVEPQRKKKIGAVAIIHFARCISSCGAGDRRTKFHQSMEEQSTVGHYSVIGQELHQT